MVFLELVKQAAEVEFAGEDSKAEFRVLVVNQKHSVRVKAALFFQSSCHL